MKYKYIAVFQIGGLIHNHYKGDVEVYIKGDAATVKAILTDKIDDYCYELDRLQSIGYLMLKSLAGQMESDDLRVEIEAEVGQIRERRKKELDHSDILVFMAEGDVPVDFSRPHREADDYVLGFELINKETIIEAHTAQVNAVLASLCLSTEHETLQVKHIKGGVFLINDSGKPIYSFDTSCSGEAFISKMTTDEIIEETKKQVPALISNHHLSRVYNLLVQAISSDNDKFRHFMSGWLALEILINKVFSEYENRFVQNLLGIKPAGHTQRYFERIRGVMKNKYNILDKFIVLAACIGDESTEADIQNFTAIKEKRDALLHGETINEDMLPISETVRLLVKYLRRHINAKNA